MCSNDSFEETLTRGIGLISAGWLSKPWSGALEGRGSISPTPENSQPVRGGKGRDDMPRFELSIDRVYEPLVPLERTAKLVSVSKASNGSRTDQLSRNAVLWVTPAHQSENGPCTLHLDVTKEIMIQAHIQNDPIEKHVAPPPRMTTCPFCGDTTDDPTISGLEISWPSPASKRGMPPVTCILEPTIEKSRTSCACGITPSWPTPPRTTKQSSCWMHVAPKRDRGVEDAASVSTGLKVIEGACPCQRYRYTLVAFSTYLVITQDKIPGQYLALYNTIRHTPDEKTMESRHALWLTSRAREHGAEYRPWCR